ncbi:16S rRNA m(2)G-966 methyltransferase [Halospina denitrificans]|uniref:Ribosomal RNA small subunit methyltransferase D n=2 Tax=Halospina denitrificans TaxID=332522 RepID=A0A4R7K0M2_9GAMM|nr:16S rRNA m(2)G-966 methyltransferase [Halospina denitrificans]
MPRTRKNTRKTDTTGRVRIIAGDWRRRSLEFPAVDDVRPTPDRVRETVFNWVAPVLPGSRCLDLFAGSGALGLEALSRGAGKATFVDQSRALMKALRANLATLDAGNADVVEADVMAFLGRENGGDAMDLVFLDPPFRAGFVEPVCDRLAAEAWVKTGSLVYIEHESDLPEPQLPPGWALSRRKTAGQVCYSLYEVG